MEDFNSFKVKELDDRFRKTKVKKEHKGDSIKLGPCLTLYNIGEEVFSAEIENLEINRDFYF